MTEPSAAVQAVTGAFQGMTSDLTSILTTVAPYAIGILLVFLGFKYGKKVIAFISGR